MSTRKSGNTALHLAARNGYAEICELLIKHGAFVDVSNLSYETPIKLAALAKHLDVVAMLKNRGAKCSPRLLDNLIAQNQISMFKLFVEDDVVEFEIVSLAVDFERTEILEFLLEDRTNGDFTVEIAQELQQKSKLLKILKIGNCSDLRLVSGLKHLSNSLEELSLINLRKLHGHEEWVEFPLVKKLNVVYVLFDCYQETFALSPDAFPSLDVLELGIEKDPFRTTNDPFHKKILESYQRESSRPIKRINIQRNLAQKGLQALLMVPVEELNLDCTWYNEHLSSNIPWSEEKIITKTLKKFKWKNYGEQLSSVAFLINCKQLESLELHKFMSKIDLSALSNLPLLKELSFVPPVQEKEKSFVIKDLFRSAVVFPSLQKLELIDEKAISLFEGLENILPNLRILVSSARVDEHENNNNLLNSFLHLVRNFPKLEEIRFNGKCISSSRKMFNPMNTRIPRLLKKEKPSLIIYYPETCQYEIELEKAGPRRIAQTDSTAPSNRWATSNTNNNTNATTFSWGASTTFPGWGSTTTNKTPQEQATTTWVWNNHATGGSSWGSSSSSSSQQQSTTTSGWWGSTNNNNNSATATTSTTTTDQQQTTEKKSVWGE